MPDFELDFETVSEKRKTVKDSVTAAHQVRGDMVYSDKGYLEINPTKEVEGAWDFEIVKED